MTDGGPAEADPFERLPDRVLAAGHARVDDRGLPAAHQHVCRDEPEVGRSQVTAEAEPAGSDGGADDASGEPADVLDAPPVDRGVDADPAADDPDAGRRAAGDPTIVSATAPRPRSVEEGAPGEQRVGRRHHGTWYGHIRAAVLFVRSSARFARRLRPDDRFGSVQPFEDADRRRSPRTPGSPASCASTRPTASSWRRRTGSPTAPTRSRTRSTPGSAIASGTKGLTALTVVSLIQEGALDLDDDRTVGARSDLPLIDDAVTVEHLLAHRSGIGDYLDEEPTTTSPTT